MARILVVDDVPDVCESLALLFDSMGHITEIAANGRVAVSANDVFCPDIMFMDLDMPVLDGYGAARQIRRFGRCQPFLVALTGIEGADVEAATKASGFNTYFRKPAVTSSLLALVDSLSTRA